MDLARLSDRPVLLFDGECGLCQGLTRFLLRRDLEKKLQVAPLQGETGQMLLGRVGLPTQDFDSLVYFPDSARDEYLLRTDAVVRVAQLLPPAWARMGKVLGWIPVGLRDGGYRLVARFRHRVFGDPTPDGLSDLAFADRVLR